jgi:NADPH:quinone reductase-like Zn-dependent oxidoreductase
MKAVRFQQQGGPEVLKYEDVPDPIPSPRDAIVRVKACALNRLDIWARTGVQGEKIPLPHISGSDIVGTVESIPEGEDRIHPGDAVIVNPGIGCGRCDKCLMGKDNQCRYYTIVGYGTDGGYAEFVRVPVENLVAKPDSLDFVEASSIPLVFLTAYHMLVTKAGLQPGETVLVLGANSGVGIAAIQVAKVFGATVIATAGDQAKLAKAKDLGAEGLINHYEQDIAEQARKMTGKRGVDIVVEHVGKATWEKSIKALAKGGRLVTCGATTGADATTDLRYVFSRELTIHGSYMGGKGELIRVLELFKLGRLRPVVDKVYPLSEAKEAQVRMENSEHFGKIVLTV